MGDLVNIKQEWIRTIESHIFARGFKSTDCGYERIQYARQPGQTISINGRVMQQPGKEIEIKQSIYIIGDGWVSNLDDSNKVDFTQIRFEAYQDNNLVMEYDDMIYWTEPNYFIEIFNKIF